MANFGYDAFIFEVDDMVGGTLQDISNEVWTFNGMDVQAVLEDSHGASDAWVERLFTGLRQGADVTITGPYDDQAATATAYLDGSEGEVRTIRATWGGTKTTAFEAIIMSFKRLAQRGQITKYEATFSLTGAATEV